MKIYITLLFVILAFSAFTQMDIKLYHEQIEDVITIYADNGEHAPVSVRVDFSTSNLKISDGDNNTYVIPAKSEKVKITDLTIVKRGRSVNFGYQFTATFGDVTISQYDVDYAYNLPFKKGATFTVWQGYNGRMSHRNEKALDFTMPVGTELFAIREGVVVDVVDKNKRHCAQPECAKYNNFILVLHPDGTMADYAHIDKDGAVVEKGDKIEKGQFIGYSGNVGYTSGPHLHLAVFVPKMDKNETIETKFLVGDGSKAELLVEKKPYLRGY